MSKNNFLIYYFVGNSKFKLLKMNDVVDIKYWENSFLGKNIGFWTITLNGEAYFPCGEIASSLEYTNAREATRDHIEKRDKKTIEELLGANFREILRRNFPTRSKSLRDSFFQNLKANKIFSNEYGAYSLIMGSKMPAARSFQRWVYYILKEIRLTGSYTLPSGPFDNPLEMIQQISLQIPPYNKSSKNLERKAMCKALKEVYDSAKDPLKVKAGRKGGLKTQKDIRELKDSFYKLKDKVNNSIKKFETELEIVLKEISSERRSSSDSE